MRRWHAGPARYDAEVVVVAGHVHHALGQQLQEHLLAEERHHVLPLEFLQVEGLEKRAVVQLGHQAEHDAQIPGVLHHLHDIAEAGLHRQADDHLVHPLALQDGLQVVQHPQLHDFAAEDDADGFARVRLGMRQRRKNSQQRDGKKLLHFRSSSGMIGNSR